MDMTLLEKKIAESGISVVFLAEKAGVSRHTLYNRIAQPDGWRVNEMVAIANALHLTKAERNQIFNL